MCSGNITLDVFPTIINHDLNHAIFEYWPGLWPTGAGWTMTWQGDPPIASHPNGCGTITIAGAQGTQYNIGPATYSNGVWTAHPIFAETPGGYNGDVAADRLRLGGAG